MIHLLLCAHHCLFRAVAWKKSNSARIGVEAVRDVGSAPCTLSPYIRHLKALFKSLLTAGARPAPLLEATIPSSVTSTATGLLGNRLTCPSISPYKPRTKLLVSRPPLLFGGESLRIPGQSLVGRYCCLSALLQNIVNQRAVCSFNSL